MEESDQPRSKPAHEHLFTPSERIFVRISIWQTVLSVLGVFVAGVALYAALTESEAVRRQTAAAVWPYLQLTITDHENSEGAEFRVSMTNVGVGPALLRGMRVTIEGAPQRAWEDVIRAVGEDDSQPFSQAFAQNRVIRPGEGVDLFGVTDRPRTRALRRAVTSGSAEVEYYYCSIFDQCWVADSRTPDVRHASVARCPDYGEEQFEGGSAASAD